MQKCQKMSGGRWQDVNILLATIGGVTSAVSYTAFWTEEMADYPRPFIRYDGEDDDEDDEEDAIPKIRIGVCAMSKKVYTYITGKYISFK